jgi:PIN domain nuclease of toxin-antitoxin system
MRFLLDTHVVIWWLVDDPTLSDDLKAMIDDEAAIYVSPVTLWEVAIKQALGKLAGPVDLPERIRDGGFGELPIRFDHALEVGRLPAIHRDPFDRMLVAQARCEGLTLVTRDSNIQRYEVALHKA